MRALRIRRSATPAEATIPTVAVLTMARDEAEMLQRRLGHRELDEHPVARDDGLRVAADRNAESPGARDFAGVAAEAGM